MRWPPCESESERIVSPGSRHREVHGHVRLRARVRLDVRVLGVEQRPRAVDRELLDLVDDLAAAVVAAARIALRVLVRGDAAYRLERRRPREVLGRDQLDLAALALELLPEQVGDLGVDVGERRGPQVLERVRRDRHGPRCYSADQRASAASTRASASSAVTAPSRSTRGSGAGQVDDGGRHARELAAVEDDRCRADLLGNVLDPPRVVVAVQVRARGRDRSHLLEDLLARPRRGPGRGRRSCRCACRRARESASPGSEGRACTGPGGAPARRPRSARGAPARTRAASRARSRRSRTAAAASGA